MARTRARPLIGYAPTTFKSHVRGVKNLRRSKFVFLYVATYMYTSNPLKSQFRLFSYILTISEGELPLNNRQLKSKAHVYNYCS